MVNLCETVTSSAAAHQFCHQYIHAVLDQRNLLAGVRFLNEKNADEVWDLSVNTSCRVPFEYRGRPGLLELEETMLASVAIDQYCSRLTSSCARFAECRDGVFDRLLRHPDVPYVTTRLTARELLHVDGNELLGARRLTSAFQAVSGTMFRVELIPGLSLTSFSSSICQGFPPETYCSPVATAV